MQGKLFIFSAPSGSGKTTIVRHLLGLDLGLSFSISATSREPRSNEENGKDYYFLSPDEFRNKIKKGEFIEWEEVYANQYYGSLRSEVEKLRNQGRHVVFDIDVIGGLKLKKMFKEDALAIFIQAPSVKIMEERLRKRASDSEEQLLKRISKAEQELKYAGSFDHIIVNDDLQKALQEAEKLVKAFIGHQ